MRTHTAGLAAHLAETSLTLCTMLLLELVDGTVLGLTDHDADLSFNLDGEGIVSYVSGRGILPSDVVTSTGFEVDNYEIQMPFGDDVTLEGVIGRRFQRARARLFTVNWADLTQGASRTLYGKVADARPEGGMAVLEIRGLTEAYGQMVGSVLTTHCRADFGDAQCGVTRTEFDTTVTAAASSLQFTIDVTGIPAVNFIFGGVQFTSGALTGTREMELFSFDEDTGAIETFAPLANVPEVGDAITLFNGCSKLLMSEEDIPTCLTYENVIRYRGFWDAPGSDVYNKYQVPGAAGA